MLDEILIGCNVKQCDYNTFSERKGKIKKDASGTVPFQKVLLCTVPYLPLQGAYKSSFPKRYKSILIVFMKMTFFYLDPYI